MRLNLSLLFVFAALLLLLLSLPGSTGAQSGGGNLYRVSVSTNSGQANAESRASSISADGLTVAFESDASNLLGEGSDLNEVSDIFVREFVDFTTVRISEAADGSDADGASRSPSLSADGRFVAFESDASNLLGAGSDGNAATDVFVYDRESGTMERVSVAGDGSEANGRSYGPHISPDGRYVVFASDATNLIGAGNDSNGYQDVFLHDREANITELISWVDGGTTMQANQGSFSPRISADAAGRYVVFASVAGNLVEDDNVPCGVVSCTDIFVRDRETQETEMVSRSSSGEQGADSSEAPDISGDGRFVVWESRAGNLVPDDTNFTYDVFLRDRDSDQTTRISVNPVTGEEGNDWSREPELSTNGEWIAFPSWADNLIEDDGTFGFPDVFRYNRLTNTMDRVSVADSGEESDDASRDPSISAAGQYVSFTSYSEILVPEDSNAVADIFLRNYIGVFVTPTPTNTPTMTMTPSATSEPTLTPTASATTPATATAPATATVPATATRTPSPSATAGSATATRTPPAGVTFTATPQVTGTPPTPTPPPWAWTATPIVSATPTLAVSPTSTSEGPPWIYLPLISRQ